MRHGGVGLRRGIVLPLILLLPLAPVWGGPASATTDIVYAYDVLGRLAAVTYPSGMVAAYSYDAAGNRTQKVTASAFTQTIQITGSGPVDLRSLANTAGYNGLMAANITFEVGNGVTITGDPGSGVGIDTGTWPSGYTITLSLVVSSGGAVHGGGGAGGKGGSIYGDYGSPGGAGGDAVYVRQPISITVNGVIAGGGNGGSGGEGADGWDGSQDYYFGGGGGGGGFPNGPGGAGGTAPFPYYTGYDGNPGADGTTSGGGAGGAGEWYIDWMLSTESGTAGDGAGDGYAIRKNGHTVPVSGGGTITGAAS